MLKTITLALALLPGAVAAQSFEGTVVDLQFQRYEDGSGAETNSIEGNLDASWQFGALGVQAGLALGKDVNDSGDISIDHYHGFALHLTADVSGNLRFGAMVAADNAFDRVYLYAAEAIYTNDALRVEGRLGDSFNNARPFTLFEVDSTLSTGGPLSLRLGTKFTDFGTGGNASQMTIGAGFTLGSGTNIYADYGRHSGTAGAGDGNGSLINLGVRFNLGAGGTDKAFSYQPLN